MDNIELSGMKIEMEPIDPEVKELTVEEVFKKKLEKGQD